MTNWDLWEKEWSNAYKFFNSKGNIQTKARLKKKWHDEFFEMIKSNEVKMNKELLTTKELRELLGHIYNDLPIDDEELIKEAKNTYFKFKRIHKNCISKLKVEKAIDNFKAKLCTMDIWRDIDKEGNFINDKIEDLKKEMGLNNEKI